MLSFHTTCNFWLVINVKQMKKEHVIAKNLMAKLTMPQHITLPFATFTDVFA